MYLQQTLIRFYPIIQRHKGTFHSVSFAIALAIYAFTYYLYHYLGDGGNFGTVYHTDPVKPLVTVYFGIWGVMHQFAALTSFVAGLIFFPKEKRK